VTNVPTSAWRSANAICTRELRLFHAKSPAQISFDFTRFLSFPLEAVSGTGELCRGNPKNRTSAKVEVLATFEQECDIIIANPMTDTVADMSDKVFTRDLSGSE